MPHRPAVCRAAPPSDRGRHRQTDFGTTTAPEIIEAIANAANVFREDVGRYPTQAEAQAGLVLADTQAALFTYLEREIQVGDRVLWAEHDDEGELLRPTRDRSDDTLVFAYGTVTAQPDGWNGKNIITRDEGRTAVIDREWLVKVPEGEEAVGRP